MDSSCLLHSRPLWGGSFQGSQQGQGPASGLNRAARNSTAHPLVEAGCSHTLTSARHAGRDPDKEPSERGIHATSSTHATSCPWLLPPGLGVSLGPHGGSPTHAASRAATEAGCPGALGVPVSRREQAHGRAPRGEVPKHPSPVGQQRLLHAERELWVGPQLAGPAPGSVSGCTHPAVSGSTVGTCRGNVSAPGHSPLGPSWLPAPMPRGTHAARVPHSAGLCFLLPHQVGASGDKGAALVRALQRPRQGRCRHGVRQGSPVCGRAGPGLTCCTRPWSGTPPPCRTPRWCCIAGSRGGRTSWLQSKGGT